MTVPITIAIPVGPHPSNVRWLGDALTSIATQTERPDEILLIDDGAHLDPAAYPGCRIWATPWQSGVAHAFNFGVALALNDLVLMLGSDDMLLPECVATVWRYWQGLQDPLGYYALPVVYDNGKEQADPCNAALVTKQLWRLTGGFPVESAIGACDSWLISKMWVAKGALGTVYTVGDRPLYWYRDHGETDTHARAATWELLLAYRDLWLRNPYRKEARDRYAHWRDVQWSDIQAHLPTLYAAACGNVLELGVRAGVSTAALLAGVADHGGHVWSIDRDDCRAVFSPNPDWTFIQTDSCDGFIGSIIPDVLDCLFIDTGHTADLTYRELTLWGPRVRVGGLILLHDTDDGSTYPGVRDAMEAWCAERALIPTYQSGSYGLGVIRC